MKSRVKKHLESNFPFLDTKRLLIAVSGGVDSMVLVHLLRELSYVIGIAHCNFQLRGEESNLDEQLVKDYCKTYNLSFYSKRFETKTPKQSTQMAARTLRYDWFKELCIGGNYDFVLTAHHADDNIETLFMNLTRGTGIEGLTGIPEINGKIVRPLLPFYKSEIVDYAKEKGIPWREDRSNQTDDYLRNAIRHHVIPQLTKLHPKALENTTKTIGFTKDAVLVIHEQTEQLKKEFFQDQNDTIHIPIKPLNELQPLPFWTHQLFSSYGFDNGEVMKLMNAQKGKQLFSRDYILEVGREVFLLYKTVKRDMEEVFEVHKEGLSTPLVLTFSKEVNPTNDLIIDEETISFPLELRKWRRGDHFYPTGMNGSKKVSKFFKDEKYTANEKAAQWLLCSGNDIVWIVGKRADRRFVATEKSQHLLNISLQ